jgi:hypothetical protein
VAARFSSSQSFDFLGNIIKEPTPDKKKKQNDPIRQISRMEDSFAQYSAKEKFQPF